jgi:tRNA G46 methylase TrmB
MAFAEEGSPAFFAGAADVGCGHGASTIVMAEAYPNSEFFGFDYDKPSIERAKVKCGSYPAFTPRKRSNCQA